MNYISSHNSKQHFNKLSQKTYYKNKNLNVLSFGDMKNWVNSIDNSRDPYEYMDFYESKKQWIDLSNILKELTRKHKFKVLDIILNNYKGEYESKKFKLHNENVWIGKDVQINEYEAIINTFEILIKHGFNFIELSTISNYGTKLDVIPMLKIPKMFYMSVINKDKRIPEHLQNQIFKYYTYTLKLKTPEEFILGLKNPDIMVNTQIIINKFFESEIYLSSKLENAESFIGALINPNNKINTELKNKLYIYFTREYFNLSQFVTCLRLIFNKISENNIVIFKDNLLFILSKNVDIMSYEIFKLLLIRESTNIIERIIFSTLLSEPLNNSEYSQYFLLIDINKIKEKFVFNIIENYEIWISDCICLQKKSNPMVNENEFKFNNMSVIFMIFGISYSHGYYKNEIIEKINKILFLNKNFIKPFGIFLETSKIDYKNLVPNEYLMIKEFIKSNYYSKFIMDKLNIETILSKFTNINNIRKFNIELFINTGSFNLLIESNNLNNIKKDYNLNNNEIKTEIKTEIEIEFPEPNNLIVKNISLYLNSNDKISAFEDLIYFITNMKILLTDFSYAIIYSLFDCKISDFDDIKKLLNDIINNTEIKYYENIKIEVSNIIKSYPKLMEMIIFDNPQISTKIVELLEK